MASWRKLFKIFNRRKHNNKNNWDLFHDFLRKLVNCWIVPAGLLNACWTHKQTRPAPTLRNCEYHEVKDRKVSGINPTFNQQQAIYKCSTTTHMSSHQNSDRLRSGTVSLWFMDCRWLCIVYSCKKSLVVLGYFNRRRQQPQQQHT